MVESAHGPVVEARARSSAELILKECWIMSMTTLNELFDHELKDIYYAEHQLVEALQTLADESSDENIRKAFQSHRKETQGHIKRLDQVFKSLGEKPTPETCPGIDGLLKEKKAFAKEKPSDEILDFYNLAAAQKTERYEITAYESLIEMADALGRSAIVTQLEANLQEEEAALQKLKGLAAGVNKDTLIAEEDED
jgi:ferritin-like metal-binding protein YciE